MLLLIRRARPGGYLSELAQMYRLRRRVFKDRLDWEVETVGDMEVDQYDALNPFYLLLRGDDGWIQGCVRLLPSTGPNMLRDTFPVLLDTTEAPSSDKVWESSRFALDAGRMGIGPIAKDTFELFAGMVEFGLARQLTSIVTVTDTRMERILRRAGWPLRRIGSPRAFGKTEAVAGHLEVSRDALEVLRQGGGFNDPVLWEPSLSD